MPQIESKNLSLLQEQMYFEALASKKCSLYEQQLSDPLLQQLAGQLAQHHRSRFDSLNSYLSSHN